MARTSVCFYTYDMSKVLTVAAQNHVVVATLMCVYNCLEKVTTKCLLCQDFIHQMLYPEEISMLNFLYGLTTTDYHATPWKTCQKVCDAIITNGHEKEFDENQLVM